MNWYNLMGHYGAYVWPAYGFAALMLGGLMVRASRSLKQAKKTLKERYES